MLQNINDIISILKKSYPSLPLKELTKGHPFKTLIATILSQRARDETTIKIADHLFKTVGQTPQDFIHLPLTTLERLIFSSGFYKAKAKNIQAVSKIVVEQYDGKVPQKLKDLLTFPGVGRKTANIVLNTCFDIPAIAVDVHVHRISNRLGWIRTKTPEKSEFALMKVLPKKYWSAINHLLVRHGQEICTAKKPKCYQCPIEEFCEYKDKNL